MSYGPDGHPLRLCTIHVTHRPCIRDRIATSRARSWEAKGTKADEFETVRCSLRGSKLFPAILCRSVVGNLVG